MGVDREGKHGGAFFQLFDWTAKSRKKLFSSKSDLSESSRQGKRMDWSFQETRKRVQIDEDETGGAGSSMREGSDYSCATSVTDEDGYRTKAPGVVARLMGLDSVPITNFSEPSSTLCTQSLRDFQHTRKNLDHHQHVYSGNNPIERFQTEVLPPKSVKPIPITQNRMLSPMKNPGSFHMKNAACIMEAAARIIEASPQSASKARMPMVGSSSVPIKVRDLKEKVEVARKTPRMSSSIQAVDRTSRLGETSHRPVESKATKYLKGQPLNKSWNGFVNTSSSFSCANEEDSSDKGKSISLAVQAKVNVQRREGLSLVDHKEQNNVNSLITPFKSQQNDSNKKSPVHGVFRQNSQKRNCRVDKGRSTSNSKPSVPNLHNKKLMSGDSSYGRSRTSGKIVGNSKSGCRKLGLNATESEKQAPYSSARNYARKKISIQRDFHNQAVEKTAQSTDRHLSWAEESKRKGMDVISFTFTAPLTRSLPDTSSQFTPDNNWSKRLLLDTNSMKVSSPRYNVDGGDALSLLLEQKLRELSYGTNSSRQYSFNVGPTSSSSSISEDLVPSFNAGRNKSELLSSRLQVVDEECSSSYTDANFLLDCRHPSPISVLEPSTSNESSNSSDSVDSSILEGIKHCSSVQCQEVLGLTSLKKRRSAEVEMELSDSASYSSTGTLTRKHATWDDLDYVKEILSTADLTFKDLALGEIINPRMFDQIESWRGDFSSDGGDNMKLRWKLLFDSVSECLDLRSRQFSCGGYRVWVKGTAMVRRNELLSEEIHNEISNCSSMGDCMVDELVDHDMSSVGSEFSGEGKIGPQILKQGSAPSDGVSDDGRKLSSEVPLDDSV